MEKKSKNKSINYTSPIGCVVWDHGEQIGLKLFLLENFNS